MDELLQKHGCSNVFRVPEGLKELMSDISREVLRSQPIGDNLCKFISDYLSALMITRQHGLISIRITEQLCDCRPSVIERLIELGLSHLQSKKIAQVIQKTIESGDAGVQRKPKKKEGAKGSQEAKSKELVDLDNEAKIDPAEKFDKFSEKLTADLDRAANFIKAVEKEEVEKEAKKADFKVRELELIAKVMEMCPLLDEQKAWKVCLIARNAFKDYWYTKKRLEQELGLHPRDPWELAAAHTLEVYAKTKPSHNDLVRAARIIQSAYRGYHYRRKVLPNLKQQKNVPHKGPKRGLFGPPIDIAGEREIELGPCLEFEVDTDDVNAKFAANEKTRTQRLQSRMVPSKLTPSQTSTPFYVPGVAPLPAKPSTSSDAKKGLDFSKKTQKIYTATTDVSDRDIVEIVKNKTTQVAMVSQDITGGLDVID